MELTATTSTPSCGGLAVGLLLVVAQSLLVAAQLRLFSLALQFDIAQSSVKIAAL